MKERTLSQSLGVRRRNFRISENAVRNMKKLTQTALVMIIAASICAGRIFSIQLVHAASSTKIHQAYEKIIRTKNKKISKQPAYNIVYFTYYDINRDGTDELFMLCTNDQEGKNSEKLELSTDMLVYTYVNGSPKKLLESLSLGGNWGYFSFHKDSRYFAQYDRVGWSDGGFVFKKLVNGKFVKAGECSYQAKDYSNASAGMNYKIGARKVTKKQYNQYVKKMSGNKKLTMYRVTQNNMEELR